MRRQPGLAGGLGGVRQDPEHDAGDRARDQVIAED